jgi:riboflavin synthase
MFTGLVEHVGEVVRIEQNEEGVRLTVRAAAFTDKLQPGDSIAVDGTCLTVTATHGGEFSFDAVGTTLSRTTIGQYVPGRQVNLEQAVRAGSPLGGHLVQGHVDAVADVLEMQPTGESWRLRIRLPPEVLPYCVARGSLAVDGVSLTIAELTGNVAEIAIIPYTLEQTNFGRLEAASQVNLEADLIGKYVAGLLGPYRPDGQAESGHNKS